MKKYFLILIYFLLLNCSSNKTVYWCGDHPCINKKERESYFKKTMIVEIRDLEKSNKKKSEIEKLMEQARQNEKKRIINEKDLAKQAKLEQKRRIKEEKKLAKQAKLEEKRRIKEEKELAKQAKLEEKRRIKDEKELAKQIEQDVKKSIIKQKPKIMKKNSTNKKIITENSIVARSEIINVDLNQKKFETLVEKITKKNSFRSYPDINDIPN